MRKSMPSNQMKALTMAMAGATVAAVATMFVPASMLEGLTGATGLSEIVPPAAAPLGDTARALIAFAAGASHPGASRLYFAASGRGPHPCR